jgi:hypothetical protein
LIEITTDNKGHSTMFERLKRIFSREPRTWSIIGEWDQVRSRDGKIIAHFYILQDQYGNIKQTKVGMK